MKNYFHTQITKLAAAALATAALGACGGGGGGGDGGGAVSGLEMAHTMSVVTAQSVSGNTFARRRNIVASPLPAGDFAADKQNVYVYDESMDSLQTVNMILCLMDQTKAADMVNKGPYLALVDEDRCEQGKNQSSAGTTGQSSGGQVATYNKWTVVSSRADNNAPQIVKIWIPQKESDSHDGSDILVEVTIDDGVSTTKPFGSFTLNFAGVADAGQMAGGQPNGNLITVMKGTLKTVANGANKPQFQFVNISGSELGLSVDSGSREAANVVLDNTSGTTGRARALRSETGDFDNSGVTTRVASYALDFDSTHVMRAKDADGDDVADGEKCLSRTNFNTQAWRYNLYDASTGARVALDSGFPFTYNGKYGNLGYYGLWYEGGTVPDGATISRMTFGSNTTTSYTLRVSPGKLVKRTANTVALDSLEGEEMYYWGQVGSNPPGQYLVVVESGHFMATAGVTWDQNGRTTTDLPSPVDLTPSSPGMLWLWSDALGGNVTYVGGATDVTFYAQAFVLPNDTIFTNGAVTVNCYQRCVKGGLTQSDITAANGDEMQLYYPDKTNQGDTPYAYVVDVANGKLRVRDHLNKEVRADALDMSSLPGHEWGVGTGEMITGTVNNPWDIYSQTVSYHWETGPNNWNQQVVAQKIADGTYPTFDRPLQFTYTFTAEDNRNPSDTSQEGKKMMLQYGGDGQLNGFPWVQEPGTNRWHSAVTFKDGVVLNDGTKNYIVKAIELEQSMQLSNPADATDLSACTDNGLDAAGLFGDANMTLPTASDMGTVSFTLNNRPTVTSAPAVIGGVLQ